MNRLGVPDHKQGTRPDDSSQKKPARQLVDTAHFEFFTPGPPGRNPQGARTGEQDHHSVGMDLDAPTRKLHQNWLHPCLLPPGNAREDGPSAGAGPSSGKKARARCQLGPISTSRVGRLAVRSGPGESSRWEGFRHFAHRDRRKGAVCDGSKSFVFTAGRLIDYDEEVCLPVRAGDAPSHSIQWSWNNSSLEHDHVIGSVEKPGV